MSVDEKFDQEKFLKDKQLVDLMPSVPENVKSAVIAGINSASATNSYREAAREIAERTYYELFNLYRSHRDEDAEFLLERRLLEFAFYVASDSEHKFEPTLASGLAMCLCGKTKKEHDITNE